MENKVKSILASILNLSVDSIDNTTSQESIEQWDSWKHMNLVVALEEEFNIEFEDDDIDKLLSFSAIIDVLKEKI